eukprot:400649-Amorphochlora_amoeboformis.AAC.1
MATIRSKGFQEFEEASYAAISPIPGSPGALISAHVKHILAYRRLRDRLSEYVSSKDATGELGDLLEEGGEGEGGKQEQGVLKGKGLDIRRMNLDKYISIDYRNIAIAMLKFRRLLEISLHCNNRYYPVVLLGVTSRSVDRDTLSVTLWRPSRDCSGIRMVLELRARKANHICGSRFCD